MKNNSQVFLPIYPIRLPLKTFSFSSMVIGNSLPPWRGWEISQFLARNSPRQTVGSHKNKITSCLLVKLVKVLKELLTLNTEKHC